MHIVHYNNITLILSAINEKMEEEIHSVDYKDRKQTSQTNTAIYVNVDSNGC